MEKIIEIEVEDPRENALLLAMYERHYLSILEIRNIKTVVKVSPEGRKFLDKLINPIKQNNTEKK